MDAFCKRCNAPVKQEKESNLEWYACTYCGYGHLVVDGQIIKVIPSNKPDIYQ